MAMIFPTEAFSAIETPFYYYDVDLLKETLATAQREAAKYKGFHIHYAVKANYNPAILGIINDAGMGADCVSGGEVRAALEAGIPAEKIVFAGVGKTDKDGEELLVTIDDDDEFEKVEDYFNDLFFGVADYDNDN